MAYIFIFLGAFLGYLTYLGTANLQAAGSLLKAELFTNQPPFYKWFAALALVALLGYIDELRPLSVSLLVLIILAIVLSKSHSDAVLGLTQTIG